MSSATLPSPSPPMRLPPRPSPRHRARAILAIAAALALGACGGEVAITSPPGGGTLSGGGLSGGGGTPATTAGPVGRWTRTLVFEDGWGGYASSETTWDFARDSIATRVNVARNITFGTNEVFVSTARWWVDGTVMTVRFVTPDTGTVRFRWRVDRFADGDVLWLDDTPFVRAWP